MKYLLALLFITGCASKQDTDVFLKATKTEVKNGLVTLCKERVFKRTGESIPKIDLMKGIVSYKEVFAHFFSCIESKPPHVEYVIPANDWYNGLGDEFVGVNYKQFRLKNDEPDFLCEYAENIDCKDVLNRVKILEEFILKEKE